MMDLYVNESNLMASSLSIFDVWEILKFLDEGEKVEWLAKEYGVSKNVIVSIQDGKRWKRVYEEYKKEKKLQDNKRASIRDKKRNKK